MDGILEKFRRVEELGRETRVQIGDRNSTWIASLSKKNCNVITMVFVQIKGRELGKQCRLQEEEEEMLAREKDF